MIIHLFGIPRFRAENRLLQGLPAKAFLAIALLLIKYNGVARRSTLASYLWEDRDTNLANANLRQLLAGIRRFEKQNSLEIIKADRNNIYLANSVLCDLKEFISTNKLTNSEKLKRYVVNFREDFLQGLEDSSGSDLNNWIMIQRQNFSNQFLQIVCDSALQIGENEGSKALNELLLMHPYNEEVLQTLILVLIRNGDNSVARKCFDEFAIRLSQDLNVKPSIETLSLIARLLPEMIPELQSKYSFLSKSAARRATLTSFDNNQLITTSKNNNPIPRLLILPPSSGVYELPTKSYKLAASLIEDITLLLCQINNFIVLAPHTARQFVKLKCAKTQPMFDVDYIISTRLMPNNNHSNQEENRYVMRLTSALTGEVLMSEEVLLKPTRFQKGYSDAVQSLTSKIGLKVDRSILSKFRNTGSSNAYTFYLIGKERLNIGDLPNVRAARKAFKRAIQLAPDFHVAQQMLARTYNLEWFLLGRQEKELLLEAKNIANRLIETDSTFSGGHWELGNSQMYLGDIAGALESNNNAIIYAPHYADIIADKAGMLVHNGDHQEALKQIDKAMKMNPLPPFNYYWAQGSIYFFLGNYQKALESASLANSVSSFSSRLKAACNAMMGNKAEAKKFRNHHLYDYPDFKIKSWSKLFPIKESRDKKHYEHALHLAGFN